MLQGQISSAQWQQLKAQVRAWEVAARAALEATCGHYARDEHLLPFLKLRPLGTTAPLSTQHACVALTPGAPQPPPHAAENVAVRPGVQGQGGDEGAAGDGTSVQRAVPAATGGEGLVGAGERMHGTCDGGAAGPQAPGGGGERARVAVQVVASVRVFVVVQEAVGRLPGRVWLRLDAGAGSARSTACDVHAVVMPSMSSCGPARFSGAAS